MGLADCAAGRAPGAAGNLPRIPDAVGVAAAVVRAAAGARAATNGRGGVAAKGGAARATVDAGGGAAFPTGGRPVAGALSAGPVPGIRAGVVAVGGSADGAIVRAGDAVVGARAVGLDAGVVACGLATGDRGTTGGFSRSAGDTVGVARFPRSGGGADLVDGGFIGEAGGAASGRGRSGFALIGRGVGAGAWIGAAEDLSMRVVVSVGVRGTASVAACRIDAGALTGCPVIGVCSGVCDIGNVTCNSACGVGIATSVLAACESRADAASVGGAAGTLRARRGAAGLSPATIFALADTRFCRGVTSVLAIASFFGALRRRAGLAGAVASTIADASFTAALDLRLRGGF